MQKDVDFHQTVNGHLIWTASWQNKQNDLCAQRRLRSALASAQSDQSWLSAWRKLRSLATHWAHSEDSDQTERMPRPIWVFAARSCHFVGFVMRRLIWNPENDKTYKIMSDRWRLRPLKSACCPCSLISPYMKELWLLGYQKSGKLECANVQAESSLCWGHISFDIFCYALAQMRTIARFFVNEPL